MTTTAETKNPPTTCGMVGVLQDPDGHDYNWRCEQPGTVEVDGILMCQDCACRLTESAIENGEYPEDWQEQGWCCRECAAVSWYGMSLDLRREFAAEVAARRAAEANRQVNGQLELL